MRTKHARGLLAAALLLGIATLLIGCSSGDFASILGGGNAATTKTIMVADYGNGRALLYNYPVTTGQSAVIVLGQPDFTTSSGAASASVMSDPNDVEVDKSGNLWVADTDNNRILEFKPPFANGMAASLVIGQADFTSSGCATTATNFCRASSGVFDAHGNLWVDDESNNRVLEFVPPFSNGMAATLVLGQTNMTSNGSGTTATTMSAPWEGIAFDSQGNLFVSDLGNSRVLEFKPPFSTGMAASVAIGQPDLTSGTGALTQSGLSDPYGIRFDSAGNLWVADDSNGRVLEFKPPFTTGMNASLVIGEPDFVTDNAAQTAAGLAAPSGLAFDSAGNLYVTDQSFHRTTIYAPPFSNGMAATKVLGQADLTSANCATTAAGQCSTENVQTMP